MRNKFMWKGYVPFYACKMPEMFRPLPHSFHVWAEQVGVTEHQWQADGMLTVGLSDGSQTAVYAQPGSWVVLASGVLSAWSDDDFERVVEPVVDVWQRAVDDALVGYFMTTDPFHTGDEAQDARDAVNALLESHAAVALDPRVSEQAQALVDRGRAEAADAAETLPDYVALLRRALAALEHHRRQTRPIAQTDAVIEALRTALAAKGYV